MSGEATQIVDQILDASPESISEPKLEEATPKLGEVGTKPEAPKQDEKVSSRLEVLIKREQQALARERQAKQIEAELEAKMKAFEDRENRVKEFETAKTSNSKKALELLGMDYDQLTQSHLNDGAIPPEVQIKKLEERIEHMRLKNEEAEKRRSDETLKYQELQQQKVINDFKSEITSYVKDNSDRYENIAFEEAEDEVFALIDKHYSRTIDPETGIGKVMDIKEAADKVEEFFEKRELERKKLKKAQALWGITPPAAKKELEKQANKTFQLPKTLTNNLSANTQPRQTRPLSDDERVQRALAEFHARRSGA